jgi:hypothetical protein
MKIIFAFGVIWCTLAGMWGRQAYVGQASKHIQRGTPRTTSAHHLHQDNYQQGGRRQCELCQKA